MSHRNPLEALEPRLLMAADRPNPPPTDFGVFGQVRNVYINGSAARDVILVNNATAEGSEGQIQVQINATTRSFQPGAYQRFFINGFGGDDTIRIEAGLRETFHPRVVFIRGGDGNDTITGSERKDKIFGEGGDDLILGFTGNDQLHGGAGNDRLDGGYGHDRIFGDDGNDVLIGGPGNDRMFGGAGDDVFRNAETPAELEFGATDLLHGGGGNDSADTAPLDRYRDVTGRNLA